MCISLLALHVQSIARQSEGHDIREKAESGEDCPQRATPIGMDDGERQGKEGADYLGNDGLRTPHWLSSVRKRIEERKRLPTN